MVAVIRMALLKHPDSRGVQTMITELLTSLDRRFQFVFGEKHLMVATLLDPRFKDRFMPTEVRQRVFEWLADEVMRRDEDLQNEIPTKRVAVEASQLPESQSSVWDAFDQVIQASQVPADDAPVANSVDAGARANRASVMQLIRVYVAEPTVDRMMDPLKWWAENGNKKLAAVARQFLCPPPTSVPSERLFSGAGLIYSDRRSRLTADKAEMLMFIRTNMAAF
jgi:hypothetical protein